MKTRRFYNNISFEVRTPSVVPPPAVPVEQLFRNFMRTGKLDAYVNPDTSYDFPGENYDTPDGAAKAAAEHLTDPRPENMSRFEAAQILHEQKPNMPKAPDAPAPGAESPADPTPSPTPASDGVE